MKQHETEAANASTAKTTSVEPQHVADIPPTDAAQDDVRGGTVKSGWNLTSNKKAG